MQILFEMRCHCKTPTQAYIKWRYWESAYYDFREKWTLEQKRPNLEVHISDILVFQIFTAHVPSIYITYKPLIGNNADEIP
jgi:hypothetical protein